MCVIIISEVRPTLALLKKAERSNADGGGFSWSDGKQVHFHKGLNAQQIYDMTKKLPPPFIIHFRIATVGGKSKALTHPFPMGGGTELNGSSKIEPVLFHNGHVSKWTEIVQYNLNQKYPSGPMSDTRAIAWVSKIAGVDWLDTLAGSGMFGNKFACMHPDGTIQRFGTFYKYDNKSDDISVSNDYFDWDSYIPGNKNTGKSYDRGVGGWRDNYIVDKEGNRVVFEDDYEYIDEADLEYMCEDEPDFSTMTEEEFRQYELSRFTESSLTRETETDDPQLLEGYSG